MRWPRPPYGLTVRIGGCSRSRGAVDGGGSKPELFFAADANHRSWREEDLPYPECQEALYRRSIPIASRIRCPSTPSITAGSARRIVRYPTGVNAG